jgi:uncharacterized protein YndB with AHSA1/START domain
MTPVARIAVERRMAIPHDRVWSAIADLASHPVWMRDAKWVVFVHDQRRGVGTRMKVKTVVGPFRTIDLMEVVGWAEGRSIEVAHRGLVKGRGALSATPEARSTVVSWEESLTFPWWLGGPITAWLATPWLRSVWSGNLKRLEDSLSAP